MHANLQFIFYKHFIIIRLSNQYVIINNYHIKVDIFCLLCTIDEDGNKKLHRTLSPAAKDFITEHGYDPLYGARPLKRFLQSNVETALARKMIGEELLPGTELTVDEQNGQLIVR